VNVHTKAEQIVLAWIEKKTLMGDLIDAIAAELRDAHEAGKTETAGLQKELAAFNKFVSHDHGPLARCGMCDIRDFVLAHHRTP
jgi:hypothetical protein